MLDRCSPLIDRTTLKLYFLAITKPDVSHDFLVIHQVLTAYYDLHIRNQISPAELILQDQLPRAITDNVRSPIVVSYLDFKCSFRNFIQSDSFSLMPEYRRYVLEKFLQNSLMEKRNAVLEACYPASTNVNIDTLIYRYTMLTFISPGNPFVEMQDVNSMLSFFKQMLDNIVLLYSTVNRPPPDRFLMMMDVTSYVGRLKIPDQERTLLLCRNLE